MSVTVITPDKAETIWVVRDRLRLHGALGGTGVHLLEVDIPPGSGTPPHRHQSPEMFKVNAGTVTFNIFDQQPPRCIAAEPGTIIRIESWVPHNYANASDGPAAMEVLLEESMVNFFRDAGSAEQPAGGPPTNAEIGAVMAACARHGIEVMAGAPA